MLYAVFKSWRTSLAGLVMFLCWYAGRRGVVINPAIAEDLIKLVGVVGLLFSADGARALSSATAEPKEGA